MKIREGFWLSTLRTVSHGINEREEGNIKIDYQVMIHSSHYQHSMSCLPYCTNQLLQLRTLDLKQYRRISINTSRPRFASAPSKAADQSRPGMMALQRWTRPVLH
jgi:hypothetical protein